MEKWQEFLAQVEKQLKEKGLKAAAASRLAVGNPFLIYNLRKGHKPSVENLERLCKVLDLNYSIDGGDEKSGFSRPPESTFGDAEEAAPGLINSDDLKELIAKSGLSDRRISLNCGEREDFVRDIKKGRKPAFDSVFKLLKVLGYKVHLMPDDGGETGPPRDAKAWQTDPHLPRSNDAGEAGPGLAPVKDRQLAEVLAIIADHYEQENEYGRKLFLADLKAWRPALFQDRGAPLERVVAWLGWKIVPGAGGPKVR